MHAARAYLVGAQLRGSWGLQLECQGAGTLELYLSSVGFVWNWNHKPNELVELLGVIDDLDALKKPYSFDDEGEAIEHILASTGRAFSGACGLIALH
jgi:hypothetical protein